VLPQLPSIIISKPIPSSLTTHPTQHPHLGYAYFITEPKNLEPYPRLSKKMG